jgi:phospholipid/cholesterol/gamma-HCH transport system substrate-binding protein
MRTKSLGVVFLVLMLAAVWLTYGVFTKKFTDYDEVVVHAAKIGLQLRQRPDVQLMGVLVGEGLPY